MKTRYEFVFTTPRKRLERKHQQRGGGKGLKLLELFKGSGSVGKVAVRMGYDVTSVDFDPIYTPDIETDILDWDYKKFSRDNNYIPDFIWASPPCNTFSPLAYPLKERNTKTAVPKSARARTGTKILYKTLEIFNYFQKKNPNLKWCMENPRGMMRNDKRVQALPFRETTYYCLYGGKKLKPTDFWSNFPTNLIPTEGNKCENYTSLMDNTNIKWRYSIPPKLIRTILNNSRS